MLSILCRIADLDPRSLACLRIGLAAVLLWDMVIALSVADDWWPMQGHQEMPLPDALVLGSPATTLRVGALGVAIVAVGLGVGFHTRWMSIAAWLGACAHQYAGRGTGDYHNAVLCTLLLWGLALPLGARWSLDASEGRGRRPAHWLAVVGGAGLAVSLAWIYLSTAAAKTGDSWSSGTAVWLALLDRTTETGLGRWLAATAPGSLLGATTWGVLAVEWALPILIVWPRTRWLAAGLMVVLHGAMWPLMDLGTFPFVMLAAAAALIPVSAWESGPLGRWARALGDRPVSAAGAPPASSRPPRRWFDRATAVVQVSAVLVTVEGHRLATRADEPWPYPGARQVARAKYILGMETRWSMYAPEPLASTGWWVAVAWRADGRLIDPITGAAPSLEPPSAAGARLRWLFLSEAPRLRENGATTQDSYRDFLLERGNGEDRVEITRLALVWVYESLIPFELPSRHQPLLALTWPDGAVTAEELSGVLGRGVSAPRYDEHGYLLGPAEVTLAGSSSPLCRRHPGMLSTEQVESYRKHGYLHIPKVFDDEEMAALDRDLERLVAEWAITSPGWSGPWRRVYMDEKTEKDAKLHGSHINQTDKPRRMVRVGYRDPQNNQVTGQSHGRPGLVVRGYRDRQDSQELLRNT